MLITPQMQDNIATRNIARGIFEVVVKFLKYLIVQFCRSIETNEIGNSCQNLQNNVLAAPLLIMVY